MKVTLYTTFYEDKDPRRQDEIEHCLRKNVECKLIDEVVLLNQRGARVNFLKSPKIEEVDFGIRPNFSDFVKLINDKARPDDFSIIANSDIYFDGALKSLRYVDFERTALALTRWNLDEDGGVHFYGKAESQDAWVFRGKCRGKFGEFPIGQYGCDNRLAWELRDNGYRVLNPSLVIRSYHYHCSQSRPYLKDKTYQRVSPPYLYVRPGRIDPWWRNLMNRFLDRERYLVNKVDRKLYGWAQYKYFRMRVMRAKEGGLNLPNAMRYSLGALWFYPYRKFVRR